MLIVRSHGIVSFTDKDGHLQQREGPVHVHFLEDCLKNYFKDFEYGKIFVPEDVSKMLKNDEIQFLRSLGLNV